MPFEEICIRYFAAWAGFEGGVRVSIMFGCWVGRGRGFARIL